MSMINEFDREKLLSDCEAVLNPEEGQLVVTGPVVCKTCAYYVGRWCAEWTGSFWMPQPYSRETDYFATVQEAINIQGELLADDLETKLSEFGYLITD